MKLVDNLFTKYVLKKEDDLLSYGFQKEGETYFYTQLIHDDEFKLQVTVKKQKIAAKLIEMDFGEEYILIDQEISSGFVAELKEECEKVLCDIRKQCFEEAFFYFAQTKRIAKMIKDKYGIEPEKNKKGYGTNSIFRNPVTRKWVGLLMYNRKRNLVGNSEEKVEYLNLNLKKDADLYQRKGIYHPYKKRNKHWVAIIMDDTLSDQEIMDLVDISYEKSND